ncbi:MAG: hypothetical protein GY769_11925 [bacterium]|nr:hypothetical protein [bacterium]
MKRNNTTVRRNVVALSLGLLALSLTPLGQTPSARADDRDLFRESQGAPYLFVLFDNTGSMARRVDNGNTATLREDDPASRHFQAKQALDQVLLGTEGVNFGFATFPNQTGHRVTSKTTVAAGTRVNNGETQGLWCVGVGGVETNDDPTLDQDTNDYTFNWATTTTPSGLSSGDLIPLDWNDNNVQRIRERLAPNLALGECPDPTDPGYSACAGYGVERYFNNNRQNGLHRLVDERARPFLASGNTPLEGALRDFKTWYDGWRPDAVANDPDFADGCRGAHVILMTDGFETCGGNAVTAATELRAAGITTYVIGFSVNNAALENIAVAGGSPERDVDGDGTLDGVHAYTATDQDALVAAFNEIIENVRRQSRTFATAAIPSLIGSASENIYLSSFSPTDDGVSIWPGRIDSYKKPVPLVDVGGQQVPDSNKVCADPDNDENCLAWKASEKLLDQAPDATEVESDLKIGLAAGKRRVYWGRRSSTRVPEGRRFFRFETAVNQQNAFYGPQGFGFKPVPGATDPSRPDFVSDGEEVIKYFLREKTATVLDPITRIPAPVDYVMGDIFHSDPAIVGDPNRFDYFAKDLEGEIEPCGVTNDSKDRYPCFVRDQIGRRRVLLVGTNEGALHAFDAGHAFRNSDGFLEYTAGTGQELFAYVPRAVMPAIRDMSEGGGQQFTVDGPLTVDDVLRDRFFNASDPLDPTERVWSTVVIGGLREGGRSYYALDITQPDRIDSSTNLPIPDARGPGCTFAPAGSTCDRRYPESLWEFGDKWDEDNNGAADLGFTWSKVNTGRIRLIDPNDAGKTVDMYVAVFGGGLDPDFKRNPVGNQVSGNFLYMVDIETGKMVYKRRIDKTKFFSVVTAPASTPSEPAAVDTDQDSYLDTIYIGNTAGYLYKVDISEPVALETGVTAQNWARNNPTTGSPPRLETVDRITDPRWDPFPIFSTGGRSIYYPPSVIFVPELARFALAFGTGDREDLWFPKDMPDPLDGRFYVLLDDGLAPDSGDPDALPLDESDLEGFVATNTADGNVDADLLANPASGFQGGFHLKLDNKERLITKSFGLSGIVFFSTYIPAEQEEIAGSCGSTGSSRLYSIFTTNGVGIKTNRERFRQVGDFVTNPFVEADAGAGDKPDDPTEAPSGSDACSESELQAIRTSLMSKMPQECKFAQYSLNVMTLQSQSGVECIVPIPVCVVQRNWKEF